MENRRAARRSSRGRILAVARELYYQKGLEEVSFDEISEQCGISKQLIRYHFGSKAKLANEIYGQFSRDQWELFRRKAEAAFPGAEAGVILTAYSFAVVDYFRADEKAFRYYTQFFSSSFTDVTVGVEMLAEDVVQDSGRDPDEIHMQFIGGQYAARGLIYHYVTGEIKRSRRDFLFFYMQANHSSWMEADPASREALFERALAITDAVEIRYLPGFYWM